MSRRWDAQLPLETQTLAGGLDKTATFVEINRDGSLVVELYDFSEAAQSAFGSDVAFTATVKQHDKDSLLLALMRERFEDYYHFKEWLKEKDIPFASGFDPWA